MDTLNCWLLCLISLSAVELSNLHPWMIALLDCIHAARLPFPNNDPCTSKPLFHFPGMFLQYFYIRATSDYWSLGWCNSSPYSDWLMCVPSCLVFFGVGLCWSPSSRTVCPVQPIVKLFLLFVGHRRRRKYSDRLQIDGSVTYNVPQMQFIALLRLIVGCSVEIVVYSSALVFAHAFSTDRSPSRPNESGVSHGESVGMS